ncbi:hypothetical protein AMATHDRAFT_49710 [Amanita thiersii Skay4041]|uniref:cAMP-dependent protein kinase n=1 Tax=Amanita thiersii Skay4041 TaxID=703135 RepID=A0A2A9NKL9_9AGAR|nr:hypothetical protein AMATHDRAFT_49710 [Amanita thiersii Skay4041]
MDDQLEIDSFVAPKSEHQFVVDLDNCLLTSIIRLGTPNSEITLIYAAQLVASISSLHTVGIIHRQVTPETVAIRDNKFLVLCDCERQMRRTSSKLCNNRSLKDHQHQQIYQYNPPEVILGWTHGYAVDIWGFGIVLYYMLIGFHPFGDKDGQEDRIVSPKSHSLRYLHLLTEDARDLVSRCLERNPALRPTIEEIKNHAYFSEIDWSRMITRYIKVPYPGTSHIDHGPIQPVPSIAQIRSTESEALSNILIKTDLDSPIHLRMTLDASQATFVPLSGSLEARDVSIGQSDSNQVERSSSNHCNTSIQETVLDTQRDRAQDDDHTKISEAKPCDRDRRMQLVWEMIDSEPEASPTAVPARDLSNAFSYFTSRPRRLCKRRSSAPLTSASQLALWRSSIDVSTARLNDKTKENLKSCKIANSQFMEPVQEQKEEQETENFDLPPGIERIGNGIGFTYTYTLPAASRSKASICSSVPRACGIFPSSSSKFSLGLGLGLGSGHPPRKTKTNPRTSTQRVSKPPKNDNTKSQENAVLAQKGNYTSKHGAKIFEPPTVIFGSQRTHLNKVVRATFADSPNQESEEDVDDAGPLTPDTVQVIFQEGVSQGAVQKSQNDRDRVISFTNPQVYQAEATTDTPTLRLVSPSMTQINESVLST